MMFSRPEKKIRRTWHLELSTIELSRPGRMRIRVSYLILYDRQRVEATENENARVGIQSSIHIVA